MTNFAHSHCNLKIAIIGRLDQPGGVQSVILSLIHGLNRIGIIPDLLWDIPPNRELLDHKRVLANYISLKMPVPSRTLDRFPVTIRYLLRTFNTITDRQASEQYDFYYIFYNGFLVGSQTPHVRYLSGPPLLPQLDTYSPGLRGFPYRMIRTIYKKNLSRRYPVYEFHRNSNYVINSHYTAALFKEAHGVNLSVIHPPIPLQPFVFAEDDFKHRNGHTYFSRFASYKRPEMVLALAKMYPDKSFLLMGGVKQNMRAYYQSLVDTAAREELQNVKFLNTPTMERINEELIKTRFFIFPGLNEHFGMSTVEAINAGTIPFVHDSGGQREIVPDPMLRFDDSTFFEKFDNLIHKTDEELRDIRIKLINHIQQYSENEFIARMLEFLPKQTPESERIYESTPTPA